MILNQFTNNTAIIGVFLTGKSLDAALVINSKIEKRFSKKIDTTASEESVLHEVISAIENVMVKDIMGIGIGVPSLVDVKNGVVYKVRSIPSWREVHLKDILEDRFGVQVFVNNDANCFAIGEKYFGKAQKYNDLVGLIIDEGLGAGIIFNGFLYSGANCGAGEFGSIPYREHDYEYYCSEGYFDEKYGVKANILLNRAKEGDKIALAIFEQFGYDLGNVIKTIMFAVDPEFLILGGSLSEAFPYFEKAMYEKVKTFTYKHALTNFKIAISEHENIGLLGAAALYFDANNKSFGSING